MPSGIPPPDQAYNDRNESVEQLKDRPSSPMGGRRERVADTPRNRSPASTLNKLAFENKSTASAAGFAGMHTVLTASAISSSPQSLRYNQPFSQPKLRPARCPPKHHWSEAMPIRYLPFAKRERRQRRSRQAIYADSYIMENAESESVNGMQTTQNIPLEITMYMVRRDFPIKHPASVTHIGPRCASVLLYRRRSKAKDLRSRHRQYVSWSLPGARCDKLTILDPLQVLSLHAFSLLPMRSPPWKGFC